jgi:hypothetical protein
MKRNSSLALLLIISWSLFIVPACKKDNDNDPVNEEELITTVIATFIPSGGGAPVVFSFKDVDGSGGNAPVVVNDTLAANASYNLSLLLLNESVTPADTISNEVFEEGDEHQMFFQVQSGLNLSVAYNDADVNGKPIGLNNTATTTNASSGKLTVTLRHMPDKSAANVSTGDITNAGGETDVEVQFDVAIE